MAHPLPAMALRPGGDGLSARNLCHHQRPEHAYAAVAQRLQARSGSAWHRAARGRMGRRLVQGHLRGRHRLCRQPLSVVCQRRARGYLQAQEAAQLVLAVHPDRMGLQVGAHPLRPLHHIQGPLLRVCLLLLHHAVDIPHYEHPLPHHQLAPALALQALARAL